MQYFSISENVLSIALGIIAVMIYDLYYFYDIFKLAIWVRYPNVFNSLIALSKPLLEFLLWIYYSYCLNDSSYQAF